MKKLITAILLLCSMFLMGSMGSFGTFGAGIPYGEEDELYVHMNINNYANDKLNDAKVQVIVYDREIRSSSFDVDRNSNRPRMLQFTIEENEQIEPDYYPVRVVLLDENQHRKVKHMWSWMGREYS